MFTKIINTLNDVLWSPPLLVLCLVAGLAFTVVLRGVQIRKIPTQLKLLFNGKASEKGMSSFQAFCLAIAGRVGTGNIAGVATAIAAGGPGAVFWMWIMALIGAASSFTECTMAQLYKGEVDGKYRGGVSYYLTHGLNKRFLGYAFAVIMIVAELILSGTQSHEIAASAEKAFHIPPVVMGVALVILFSLIVFGGAKRIASFANLVVPFMAIAYIVVAIIILVVNFSNVPAAFSLIFKSAFGAGPIGGGMLGSAMIWGVRRGVYSNEAGEGTATQSAAAAEVSHPAKQGLVQCFSVYIDTLFVCTATALIILTTNAYNVIAPSGGFLVHNLETEAGAVWVQSAVDTMMPIGAQFVAVALFFFAFTTMINMYYNCETSATAFFEKKGAMNKGVLTAIRLVNLVIIFVGTLLSGQSVWDLGDVGCGLMIWSNMICLIFLVRKARILLVDFERQQAEGKDPVFNPAEHPELGKLPVWEKAYQGYVSGELKN